MGGGTASMVETGVGVEVAEGIRIGGRTEVRVGGTKRNGRRQAADQHACRWAAALAIHRPEWQREDLADSLCYNADGPQPPATSSLAMSCLVRSE